LPRERRKKVKKIFMTSVLIVAMGCAPWVRVGGLYKSDAHQYTVHLPDGWMRWNRGDNVLITRDGVELQQIVLLRWAIDEPLKHTKKKLSQEMLPFEIAEVILDDIATDREVLDFRLVENKPAKIGGESGFRVVFHFKNKDGLRLTSVYYGCIKDNWFYGIRYTAASRYYFDKDLKTFEKMVESFQWVKTG